MTRAGETRVFERWSQSHAQTQAVMCVTRRLSGLRVPSSANVLLVPLISGCRDNICLLWGRRARRRFLAGAGAGTGEPALERPSVPDGAGCDSPRNEYSASVRGEPMSEATVRRSISGKWVGRCTLIVLLLQQQRLHSAHSLASQPLPSPHVNRSLFLTVSVSAQTHSLQSAQQIPIRTQTRFLSPSPFINPLLICSRCSASLVRARPAVDA